MNRSTITAKFQTTVPKEVRQRLKIGPRDSLRWELDEQGGARVTVLHRGFLERRGTVRVGPGSAVEDVQEARRSRGRTP